MYYYNWTKGIFSKTFEIISNSKHFGRLVGNSFSNSAELIIDGKKYLYRTGGFSKQKATILNLSDSKPVGEVIFNLWRTKAEIRLNNKRYFWKYNNLMNTSWSISNIEGTVINYQGVSGGGSIVSNIEDNLLLATGLFVTNHYWQSSVLVIVAAFIPLWIVIFN